MKGEIIDNFFDETSNKNIKNIFQCDKCKKTFTDPKINVRLYSKENNMDPRINEIINVLPKLNDIEEMFIARVHVVIKVYCLSKGSIGYKGNIINMEQDIQPIINKLLLILYKLLIFVTKNQILILFID